MGTLVETFLQPEPPARRRWLVIAFLALLYLAGMVGFGIFFEWGNHTLDYHDWAEISGPRFQFLKSAVRAGQFPLHISDPSTLHGFTLRYLAVPDAFISPQLILLGRLSIQRFNLANVWLLYTLGFAGLLVLRRKLRLGPLAFAALHLLFNFNGHLLAHYGVGHATWGGYFLLPWFAWLALRLVEGDRSWRWTWLTASLLFAIWLQGSYHQYVWLLILLAFLAVFVRGAFWVAVRTGFFAILISAFRLLPPILLYGRSYYDFVNGYPSLYALWASLVDLTGTLNGNFFAPGLGTGIGPWELTAYVGLAGGLFFAYFGLYRGLLQRQAPYRILLAPLGLILLLTLGRVFEILRLLPIPLIQGDRISSRMFSVVLVFGLILAAERFQRLLDDTSERRQALAGSLLGLALVGVDLWQGLNAWMTANGSKDFWKAFQADKWSVANNWNDGIYLWLVFGGLVLSVLTFAGLGFAAWRERKRKRV